MTRREFVITGAGVALAGQDQPKSRVVIARDPALRAGRSIESPRLLKLLDRSLAAFYNRDNPLEAWKQIARPGEVVGLKVNCLAGRGTASTNPVLVDAVVERLQQAGIAAKDILIFDRFSSDLENAGFRLSGRPGAVRFAGSDALGYEEELSVFGSAGSLVSRAVTRMCDCIISLPVLKDHGIAGITAALKNMFGAIHNPNKYHLNVGDPYIADVYALPPFRRKVRLAICDATAPQYEGGPSYMPQWSWPMNSLLVARDPVALDWTGWQIIEKKRAEKGLQPLEAAKRKPTYIATAADAAHRLGTNDPNRIERVEV